MEGMLTKLPRNMVVLKWVHSNGEKNYKAVCYSMLPEFSQQNPLSGPLVRESVVDSANWLHYASILIERTFCYHDA